MIKAIIFDVGGVLYKKKMHTIYSKVCQRFNLNLDKFYEARKKYLGKAMAGKLSGKQYLSLISTYLGYPNSKTFIRGFKKISSNQQQLNNRIAPIINKLKSKYKLGILTNVTEITDVIRKNRNSYTPFKIKIVSYKVGMKKPALKIYKLLIKKLNIQPQEIIFIDDEKDNLTPAKRLGINTILFKNNSQLVKDLKELGVKI